MTETQTTTRRLWIATYRAFRVAHNQIPIMSENGVAVRLEAVRQMRDFTGKWDMPRPNWSSVLTSPWQMRKTLYKPTFAFRRFLKRIG